MSGPDDGTRAPIGALRGCEFEVVARDLLSVAANLLIVALWADDLSMPSLSVGELDIALGGALARLRAEGIFRGDLCETMLLSSPPAEIPADAVMLLGIGPRQDGSDAHVRRGLRCGAQQAMLLQARHVAFTPILLGARAGELPSAGRMDSMVLGIRDALAGGPTYRRCWTFVVDDGHLVSATNLLEVALTRVARNERPDASGEL